MPPIQKPSQPEQQPQISPPPIAPAPYQTPTAQSPYSINSQPKKSRVGITIGLVLGAVILVFILLFLALLYVGVQNRTQIIGQTGKFFEAAEKSDTNTLAELVGPEATVEDKTFITNMAKKVGESCTVDGSDITFKNDVEPKVATSRGQCDNGSQKWVFTYTKSDQGKWYLTGLVLNSGSSNEAVSKDTSTPEVSGSSCFAPNDYDEAFGYSNEFTFSEQTPYTTNVHFIADSLEYSASYMEGTIKSFADISTTNPGKDYTVHLYGSVATTNSSDLSFANQRAEKVKTGLVANGMSASKIIIDSPENITNMGSNDSADSTLKEISRSVVMKFIPACSVSDTTSTQR
ncbi:hypothetical protein EOL73_02940 [Candidatus Saccharibacteria bacterium]|nr:hypothetical protein [Candidatus Saccharibacteria bacterium]NCU40685.1 hypothetical protein [Candidatus Saccharibacteria bacterium]